MPLAGFWEGDEGVILKGRGGRGEEG